MQPHFQNPIFPYLWSQHLNLWWGQPLGPLEALKPYEGPRKSKLICTNTNFMPPFQKVARENASIFSKTLFLFSNLTHQQLACFWVHQNLSLVVLRQKTSFQSLNQNLFQNHFKDLLLFESWLLKCYWDLLFCFESHWILFCRHWGTDYKNSNQDSKQGESLSMTIILLEWIWAYFVYVLLFFCKVSFNTCLEVIFYLLSFNLLCYILF